jgi:hypothetical protein
MIFGAGFEEEASELFLDAPEKSRRRKVGPDIR